MPKPKPPDQELTLPPSPSQASAPVDLSQEQSMSESNPSNEDQASASAGEPGKVWKVADGCTIYINSSRYDAGESIHSDDLEQMQNWIDAKAIV